MHASTKLESKLFTVAIVFLMICFGLSVFAVYEYGLDVPTCVTSVEPFTKGEVIERSPKFYEVHFVAKMWNFEPAQVQVLPGSTLDIYLNSVDVNHGFQIAGTNVNLMAVPGAVNYVRYSFPKKGRYRIVCHEYCGSGHQNMAAVIDVTDSPVSTPEPQVPTAGGKTRDVSLTHESAEGQKVFQTKGCAACHSVDGSSSVGPTLKGVFGTRVEFEDGSSATVDEAYIQESIKTPKAKIVKGFQPIMPEIPLTNEEIQHVIEYIKALK